jgi:hypothetical protein
MIINILSLNQLGSQTSTVHCRLDHTEKDRVGIVQSVFAAIEAHPVVRSLFDLLLLKLHGFEELFDGFGVMALGWWWGIIVEGGGGASFAAGVVVGSHAGVWIMLERLVDAETIG